MLQEGTIRTAIIGDHCLEDRYYAETVLQTQGYNVLLAEDGEEVLGLLGKDEVIDLVLLDLGMPNGAGMDTFQELRKRHDGLRVVLMSGSPLPSMVQAIIEQQKVEFIEKPFLPEELLSVIGRRQPRPRRRARPLHAPAGWKVNYLEKIETLVRQVGAAEIPVLLQGETGVGKEVLARQIHSYSPRANRQFVKINCAALPSELVESELFGYEKGAFSGASGRRVGLFEIADQGTILLDEIGDMDVRLQAKLLQVIQDGEFRRVGGRELIKADVRIMAATHQDLRQAMKQGRFREDLYYRLNVVNIRIPPLRERRPEILPLAEYFLEKYERDGKPAPEIPPNLAKALLAYDWPGNVRELENLMRRFLILREPQVLAEELYASPASRHPAPVLVASGAEKAEVCAPAAEAPSPLARAEQAKKSAEREAVVQALTETHWNRRKAAELLQIDYKALLYKMKKLGIGSSAGKRQRVASIAVSKPAKMAAGD
jgi:two-component system response regulator AtoC